MKSLLMVCGLFLGAFAAEAQINNTAGVSVLVRLRPVASDDMSVSLGVHAGTQGWGIDITQKIDRHTGARLGFAHLPGVSFSMAGLSMGEIKSRTTVESKNFTNVHFYLDYYPFIKSGFRITPGIGYFNESTGQATVTPVGIYKYNDYPVTPAQLGIAQGTLTWDGIAPYLGAGYVFEANSNAHMHLAVDLGTYYLPQPYAKLTGTRLLSQNSINEAQFQENTKGYRWLPVLQLSLTYKF